MLNTGLTVGPVERRQPRSLKEHSADVLCSGIFRRVRHALPEERDCVRRWLSDVPGVVRTGLMDEMYQYSRASHAWREESSSMPVDFTRLADCFICIHYLICTFIDQSISTLLRPAGMSSTAKTGPPSSFQIFTVFCRPGETSG